MSLAIRLTLLSLLPLMLLGATPSDEVKQKRLYPMGEKIFLQNCPEFPWQSHSDSKKLQEAILKGGACGKLGQRESEALFYYLWDVKIQKSASFGANERIEVPHKAKCPVCGMFVAKYPRWAAKITTESGHAHYFDGVKDMMKFILHPTHYIKDFNETILSIEVTDYYAQKKLDGKKAIYVIHSDVYGPMGNELIPFETKKSAQNFIKDHGGKIVESFDRINEEILATLDL